MFTGNSRQWRVNCYFCEPVCYIAALRNKTKKGIKKDVLLQGATEWNESSNCPATHKSAT